MFAHSFLCLCRSGFASTWSFGCSAFVFWAVRIRVLWERLASFGLASFFRWPKVTEKVTPAQHDALRKHTLQVCLGAFWMWIQCVVAGVSSFVPRAHNCLCFYVISADSLSRCASDGPVLWIASQPTPRLPNRCPNPAFSSPAELCLHPENNSWQSGSESKCFLKG